MTQAPLEDVLQRIRADREGLRRRWHAEGLYGRETLNDIWLAGSRRHPNRYQEFYSAERPVSRLTLADKHQLARAYATRLQRLGIRKGDVVAVQMPGWWEATVLSQAIIAAGATLLPILHHNGPADVAFVLAKARAKMLIVPERAQNVDYLERLEALGSPPDLEHVLVVGERRRGRSLNWNDFLALPSDAFEDPEMDADDVCVLMFTSGTTSRPKGVRHTHNSIIAECRTFGRRVDPENPLILVTAPYGHIGSVLDLARGPLTGVSTIVRDRWEAAACLDLISRCGPRSMTGVPFQMLTLLQLVDQGLGDISSLKTFGLGATSISPEHVYLLEKYGIRGSRGYGSTEHPTVSGAEPDDPLEKRATTDGRVMPNVEVKLVDDEGREVPEGQPGELASRGPDLFVGYSDETLDRDVFLPGGWFLTGDIVVRDATGYISVVDRKKDIIIRGGENLSSKEIEDALAAHPAVMEAAAVGVPDPLYGEKVCAFVTLREGQALTLDAARAHFAQRGLAKLKMPERLEIVAELPRTPQGKIRKVDLRDAALKS
jgi:acyl-coenzyme A synthetase/AMP-(fatty) acid ligase